MEKQGMGGSPLTYKMTSRKTRKRLVDKIQPRVLFQDDDPTVPSKPNHNLKVRRTQSASIETTAGGRMSLAERRRKHQELIEGQMEKTPTLRRSMSLQTPPSSGTSFDTPASLRRVRTATKFYHTMDRPVDCYHLKSDYSFWSSKPSMAMFCFVGLAFKFQDARFLCGAFAVILYHAFIILRTWKHFVANHQLVKEFSEFTFRWFHCALQQAERFCDKNDRTRKAAVGIVLHAYPVTTGYVGDYIRHKRAEVAAIAVAEAERIGDRLSKPTT